MARPKLVLAPEAVVAFVPPSAMGMGTAWELTTPVPVVTFMYPEANALRACSALRVASGVWVI
jgi:hypothetical protein